MRHPDLVFWIPLMFYQGIKAETEMIVVLNQLVKGSVIVLVGFVLIVDSCCPFSPNEESAAARPPSRSPAQSAGRYK